MVQLSELVGRFFEAVLSKMTVLVTMQPPLLGSKLVWSQVEVAIAAARKVGLVLAAVAEAKIVFELVAGAV